MLNEDRGPRNDRGAATWVWLAVLAVVIAAVAIAIPFLPKSETPEPPSVAVRAKIPPAPRPVAKPVPQAVPPQVPSAPLGAMPSGDAASPPETGAGMTPAAPAETAAPKAPGDQAPPAAPVTPEETAAAEPVPSPDAVPAPATPAQPMQSAQAPQSQDIPPVAASAPAVSAPAPTPATLPKSQATPHQAPAVKATDAADQAEPVASVKEKQSDAQALPDDVSRPFTIQVGAFRTKSYAENAAIKLKRLGYGAYIFNYTDKNRLPMYLVRFGHFATREEAEATLSAFKKKEKMNAVIAISQAL